MSTGVRPEQPPSDGALLDLAGSCFVGDLDTGADALVVHASQRLGGYVCLCNSHVLTEALHSDRLRVVLEDASLRFPDGEAVAWVLRRIGHPRARRIGGPDLFPLVVDRGRTVGLRHLLVGSTEPNLTRVERALRQRYPGSEVVGTYPVPFVDEPSVDSALVEMAEATDAHLLWVALGAPKQELWIARAAPHLPGVTLVAVGAAFDFVGGVKSRAPSTMQKAGLEWLHRMGSEPRRLTSRYVRSNSEFIGRLAWELARSRRRRTQR